jgi:CSLREA domain-containing protein
MQLILPLTRRKQVEKMTQTNSQRTEWGKALVLGYLLAALLAISLLLAASKPVQADTTFTVTSPADPGNGVCDRVCTLRDAITAANNTPGRDAIRFGLTGITGAAYAIFPTSELPQITEAVTIDGYSQRDAFPNTQDKGTNAQLMVELHGSDAGPVADGLDVRADDVVVRGLAIGSFAGQGIRIEGNGAKIEGNFIGTDSEGTEQGFVDFGNGGSGVRIFGSENGSVGGASAFQRNLISDNGQAGVNLQSTGTGTEVRSNLIGTERDGTSPLGNDQAGVAVANAERALIGGVRPAEANTIAFNGDDGVLVQASAGNLDATGNRISGNSIFSNGELGIDLAGGTENAAGATANDPKDPDAGPNDLQNRPVITSATTSGSATTIKASLNSTSSDAFLIEFFSDPSGNEGKKLIGNKAVSTNATGNVTFSFVPSRAVTAGQNVTATATNVVEANTSEFSAPRKVVAQ